MIIKLVKSSFYEEDKVKAKLSDFILKSKIFSMGEQCKEYERSFASKQRRKHAVFVGSGSAANLILIQALLNLNYLKKGDKVGFSALTWATNVMPIIQLGLVPVPVDCEISTLNSSPDHFKAVLGNIKCFFITNVLGFSDKIDKIANICRKKGIIFIEDNCESLGSKVKGKLLGNFGLASTFSFFVGHHLSTIEGGMVCTDDDKLHDMLVIVRAHGWDRSLDFKKQRFLRKIYKVDDFFAKYTFYDLAYNVRPTEISGFLGNKQLDYWDIIVRKREKNFKKFAKAMAKNNDLFQFDLKHMDVISNFAMPIICKSNKLFLHYRRKFEKADVEIRPIIAGDITLHPFYKKYVKKASVCANARLIHRNGFYFGNNPDMTNNEINCLCNLISKK